MQTGGCHSNQHSGSTTMNPSAAYSRKPLVEQFAPRWTFRTVALALTATLSLYLLLPYLEQVSTSSENDLTLRSVDTLAVSVPPPALPTPPDFILDASVNTPKPKLNLPAQKLSLPNTTMNLQVALGDIGADHFNAFEISDATLSTQIEAMIFEFSDLDDPPRPITRLQPIYPSEARRRGIEGLVTLEFIVAPDGTVRDPKIIASEPGDLFTESALRAVRRWRFSPGSREGQPVTTRVKQTVNFTLN